MCYFTFFCVELCLYFFVFCFNSVYFTLVYYIKCLGIYNKIIACFIIIYTFYIYIFIFSHDLLP